MITMEPESGAEAPSRVPRGHSDVDLVDWQSPSPVEGQCGHATGDASGGDCSPEFRLDPVNAVPPVTKSLDQAFADQAVQLSCRYFWCDVSGPERQSCRAESAVRVGHAREANQPRLEQGSGHVPIESRGWCPSRCPFPGGCCQVRPGVVRSVISTTCWVVRRGRCRGSCGRVGSRAQRARPACL